MSMLPAKPRPRSEANRCLNRSPQGLRCGLPRGHDGDHNALGWAISDAEVARAVANSATHQPDPAQGETP